MLKKSVLASLPAVLLFAAMMQGQEDKATVKVRPLVLPKAELPFTLGGGKKVENVASAAALEKLAGPQAGPALAKQVDFTKEQVLFVSWGTSGPPFGTLQFVVKTAAQAPLVEFFIQEPKTDRRGEAFRIGAEFFAVPRGVTGRFK